MGKSLTAVRALARGKAHMGVAGWREFSHPRYRGWSRTGRRSPSAELSGEELLDGCAGAAGRRHRVLHGGAVHHSDRRDQRNLVPGVLRQARAARRGPARARRSSSATTANPSGPRSRCTTWRPGPADSPGLAAAILTDRPRRSPSRSAPGTRLPAWTRRCWQQWRTRFQDHLGPVRPCGLQPGLRQPGAGRRSLAAAGDGEVLPAGTGQ